MKWAYGEDGRIFIRVKVQPNAKKSELLGIVGDQLKIKIAAPPVDNKANEMIISFFAKKLKVNKSKVTVHKGLSSKDKIIAVDGEAFEEIVKRIEEITVIVGGKNGG